MTHLIVPALRGRGRRSVARRAAVALCVGTLVSLAACSSSSSTKAPATVASTAASGSTIDPANAQVCAAVDRIRAGDVQLNGQIQAAVTEAVKSGEIDPFATLLAKLRSDGIVDGVAEAYSDLAAAVPADQKDNVKAVADYAASTFTQLASFSSVDDLRTWATNITSDPKALAVQAPAKAITTYVKGACGVALTGG